MKIRSKTPASRTTSFLIPCVTKELGWQCRDSGYVIRWRMIINLGPWIHCLPVCFLSPFHFSTAQTPSESQTRNHSFQFGLINFPSKSHLLPLLFAKLCIKFPCRLYLFPQSLQEGQEMCNSSPFATVFKDMVESPFSFPFLLEICMKLTLCTCTQSVKDCQEQSPKEWIWFYFKFYFE